MTESLLKLRFARLTWRPPNQYCGTEFGLYTSTICLFNSNLSLFNKPLQLGFALFITASNTFITSPIAKMYGINHLLATEPEFKDGRYTGKVSGIPCFQSGKIDNLMPWMDKQNENLKGSYFYSDSHNDLPLLELVDNPVAINGDPRLTAVANENGWPNLDWR